MKGDIRRKAIRKIANDRRVSVSIAAHIYSLLPIKKRAKLCEEIKMRDALEAADAAAWRLIEEAPKDKIILVEGGPVIWMNGKWYSYISRRHLEWEPTHFRPLPTPPKEPTK